MARRRCLACDENLFCIKCFTVSHITGTKKRHFYFDMTYDKSLREGASTWDQPAMQIDDVPERDSSFILEATESDVSSESWERAPAYDAHLFSDKLLQDRHLYINQLVPGLASHMQLGFPGARWKF